MLQKVIKVIIETRDLPENLSHGSREKYLRTLPYLALDGQEPMLGLRLSKRQMCRSTFQFLATSCHFCAANVPVLD